MNPDNTAMLAPLGALFGGIIVQWVRGPKAIPTWAGYVVAVAAGAGLYWWVTPNALDLFRSDWRIALAQAVTWAMSVMGGAKLAKDAKAAPATNSL